MQIQLREPERLSLVAFFLRDLLQNRLHEQKALAVAQSLKAEIAFSASGMEITLRFDGTSVAILPGKQPGANASISGELNELLDVALGANYIPLLLAGKIKIAGNLFILLKLLKVLRPS